MLYMSLVVTGEITGHVEMVGESEAIAGLRTLTTVAAVAAWQT